MSPNASRLLLHRNLAELERLAVWIEGWAVRELSANLNRIALRLNQRPRKTLGFETPADKLRAVLH
jgi:IS30 family transposase